MYNKVNPPYVRMYLLPLEPPSQLPSHCLRSSQSTELSFRAMWQLPTSSVLRVVVRIGQRCLSLSRLLLPLLRRGTCSPHLHLHSCPADRLVCTTTGLTRAFMY